jgi:hypothetical protein
VTKRSAETLAQNSPGDATWGRLLLQNLAALTASAAEAVLPSQNF